MRVIDLSGAFRIRAQADRQRWYPATAALPEGTVYGMTEGNQDAIRQARLVSNPGCYPTAALLALEPLAAAGLLDGPVFVDAKSGISGAGKTPSDRTHFSENHGSVAAYSVFSHRHTAEIEQELGATGHVRPASRAARPRHPRDDLRIAEAGHDRGSRSPTRSPPRTRTRRSSA